MPSMILVFLGGGLGSLLRYMFGSFWRHFCGPERPWMATLLINILGGVFMGVLVSYLGLRGGEGQMRLRLFLGIGILGGFTTFSTFSLEAFMLWERKAYVVALGYVLASVFLSLIGLWLGLYTTRKLLS